MNWSSGSPALKSLWGLDPEVTFLNHGSFGATPRAVLDAQTRWRDEMEREPVLFLARKLPALMEAVRVRVASFLGADPAGLLPVANATTGVATVFHSLTWGPGDELLLADSTYNAVKQAARALSDRYGVRVVEVKVPFPLTAPEQVTAAYVAAFSPRTRLVVVDHVVSATGCVLPAAAIVAEARRRGVPVLVDGAHAPAMLRLDLTELGADFYTGNLHKWLCTPKGTAILSIAPAWRAIVHPLAISHGYGGGVTGEFDWTGTFDPSAWLAVPSALDLFSGFGPDAVRASNHALVQNGRIHLAEALGVALPHPDDPALYAAMAAVEVPWARATDGASLNALSAALYDQHRIEVPFSAYDHRVWVRISGQLYNAPEDYVRLADVLRTWRR
ncbi:MAG: aminotransferase class V-fold PLP-dependent enzyme [Pseudomonadota bacterium]|nr:aminotransferase class V-fold PLP-dependent enzyme [Pseudomonadota bacterium]